MKGFLKKIVAAVAAVCVCSGMVMPMKGSADGVLLGDVNNDGMVSMLDVTHLNRYLAGQVELVDYVRADVNANCVVDAIDANILTQYITESISSLPYIGYGGGSSYASVGAASVNTLKGYTIFDATNGDMVGSYYLDSNPLSTNSRGVIGTDTRYGDDSLSGVVKLIIKDLDSGKCSFASGFVVDEHTIATAAHCVFNTSMGSYSNSKASIEAILVLNNVGGIGQVLTGAYDVHVPNAFITNYDPYGTVHRGYDYAMITVSESLTPYANFNLGVMTDGMMSDSELMYCTGFPYIVDDGIADADDIVNNIVKPENVYDPENRHKKFTGTGTIIHDSSSNVSNLGLPTDRTFYHNIDVGSGNSGGPVYTVTTVGTTKYYTVVGILTGGGPNTTDESGYNYATQMTTELLHFYKNNPNIAWE